MIQAGAESWHFQPGMSSGGVPELSLSSLLT